MDIDENHVVLWSGTPDSSRNNAKFLISINGLLEWGLGGNGAAADQDVAMFRPNGAGGAGQLWVQSFTDKNSIDTFRVNKAADHADGERLFSVDSVNNAVRVGAGQSGFADSDFFTGVARKKTTDGTAQALATITLGSARIYQITIRVIARRDNATDRAFFYQTALVYREGGNASIEGSVVNSNNTPIKSSGASGWTCEIAQTTPASNDIIVKVQTNSTVNVYWVATIEYQSVSTDS